MRFQEFHSTSFRSCPDISYSTITFFILFTGIQYFVYDPDTINIGFISYGHVIIFSTRRYFYHEFIYQPEPFAFGEDHQALTMHRRLNVSVRCT